MRNLSLLRLVSVWCLGTCVAMAASAQDREADVILSAMQDELARSMAQLRMEDLERPYFISYTVDDVEDLRVSASLGVITRSTLQRSRFVTIDLRVGDPSLDNSNFGSGYNIPHAHYFRIPVDNDYDAIRNRIYLGTDEAYKSALKTLSRKRAYLQTRVIEERPDDFLIQEANLFADKAEDFDIDQAYFDNLARAASAVFRDYAMIVSSEVDLTAAVVNQYFVNSDGSRSLRGDRIYTARLTLSAKTSEGQDTDTQDQIIVRSFGEFPDDADLVAWASANAEEMRDLIASETIEQYVGPVIFVGDAAGEFFRQVFVRHISDSPSPLFDSEDMAERFPVPQLTNRVGRRVLPAFIDVYDDPTIDHLGSLKLIGSYEVDDAGGVPKRIQIIDGGKLVGLPIGTAPTKKVKEANGHARGAVSKLVKARPSNLIVESRDRIPYEDLKALMLEMCQDFDLDYGLVIGRLGDPNAPGSRAFFYRSLFRSGSSQEGLLTAPTVAFKVYADGREEPVRNVEFSDVTIRVLRDIVQTGEQQYVYSYAIGNDYEMPVSIVCQPILIEEMELRKSEAKIRRPPILPSPLAQ